MILPNDITIELAVNLPVFTLMQASSHEIFEKGIAELTFDEAARLVGGTMIALVSTMDKGKVTLEGQTVIDAQQDGREAIEGYARQMANNMAPQVDDEREIILNVTRDRTL